MVILILILAPYITVIVWSYHKIMYRKFMDWIFKIWFGAFKEFDFDQFIELSICLILYHN